MLIRNLRLDRASRLLCESTCYIQHIYITLSVPFRQQPEDRLDR